jgi:phage gpG-like protein
MDKRFKHPFNKIAPAYRELRRRLPKEVTDIAVDEFKGNFKVGGYRGDNGTTFWKERSTTSWGKKAEKTGRAILIKTGRLRRGIRPQPTYESARVVNDVPYAKVMNEGFKGKVTQRVRSFKRNLTKYGVSKKTFLKKSTKVEFGRVKTGSTIVKSFKRTISMKIPARPFMVGGKPLLNNIDKHITSQLDKLWQNL